MATERIGEDVILLTFTTRRGKRAVRRSSLWVRRAGAWAVRFHQGTPAPDA
jgi:hypothetical protein